MSTTRDAIMAAGGVSSVARELGLKPQAVYQWRKVPPRWVLDLERLSGVSRYALRPDVFGESPPCVCRKRS